MTDHVTLTDEQLDRLIARVIDGLADRLNHSATGELITPAELADRLGKSREFVYSHAVQLGAIPLGDGPRPRLAFRWPQALERLTDTPVPEPNPQPRQRSRRSPTASVPLLPIGGQR